jgi:hypothetical protein
MAGNGRQWPKTRIWVSSEQQVARAKTARNQDVLAPRPWEGRDCMTSLHFQVSTHIVRSAAAIVELTGISVWSG